MIKALLFDVFGTLVDWRSSIAREAEVLLATQKIPVDGFALADAWRAQYQPSMEAVRTGNSPFVLLDVLHRRNLDIVLAQMGLQQVDDATRTALNMAWHRLDTWPDVTGGLAALRVYFRIAPCSNGNIALMIDLGRRHGWHWDAILGAELARDYKPQPKVYLRAVEALGCSADEVVMVAAHSTDLIAARDAGLRTAFIARPDEYGLANGEQHARIAVDWSATHLLDLAHQLGPLVAQAS